MKRQETYQSFQMRHHFSQNVPPYFSSMIVVAVLLTSLRDSHAELQPIFDMNYCGENATLIVIGSLGEGDHLTVNQVLSNDGKEMEMIKLRGGPYD